MTMAELQSLSDDSLVSLYEAARTQPHDADTKQFLRALELRAIARGGRVFSVKTGVSYAWNDGQESVVRIVFAKEQAMAARNAHALAEREGRQKRQEERRAMERIALMAMAQGEARAKKHR